MRKIPEILKEAIAAGLAQFTTALDGSPALMSSSGKPLKFSRANTVAIISDSIGRNTWATTAGATLTRVGGVTTMTNAGTGMVDNMMAWMEQFTDTSFNRFVGPITRLTSTSFRYADPGPDASTTGGFIANPYRTADNGWFTWLRARLGNRLIMPVMGARGGDRSDQILARLDSVLLSQPSSAVVQVGINDIVTNLTADANGNLVAATPALIFANVRKIYDKLCAAGIPIYAATTLPIEYQYGYSPTQWAALTGPQQAAANAIIDGYNAKVLGLNALIRAECKKAGMFLCKTHEAFVDPNSAKGQPLPGLLSADHIHPAARGAKLEAEVIAVPMGANLPALNTQVASAYDNRANAGAASPNIFPFLPSTASGGSIPSGTNATGTVPTGITGASQGSPTSCVFSGVARTVVNDNDTIGYNTSAVLTPAAANDGVQIGGAGGWASSVVAGNAYYLEISISARNVAGSNLAQLFAEITFVIAGNNITLRCFDKTSSTFPNTDIVNYVFQTVPFFLPATPTNTYWDVQAICSAAGTAVTIEVGRPNVIEIPAGATLTY